MALITRLTRLFRADMHAVMDRLEEPDVLLRQAIREMEEEVARNSQQLKTVELDRQQAQTRLAEIERQQSAIGGELDLCFEAGNEQLTRTLLRRQLEGGRLAKHLQQRIAAGGQRLDSQRTLLDEQRRRLDGMRQKAAIFETEMAQAENADPTRWNSADFAITDADVDLAMLREKQKRRTP